MWVCHKLAPLHIYVVLKLKVDFRCQRYSPRLASGLLATHSALLPRYACESSRQPRSERLLVRHIPNMNNL
jgi:hypothetical protein